MTRRELIAAAIAVLIGTALGLVTIACLCAVPV